MSTEPQPPADAAQFNIRTLQIEALKQAVAAADRGEFASADEVEQLFRAYEA